MLDATPGGERQRESDRYRETLQAANEINAIAADKQGNSFIPVPEATLEGIVAVPPKDHAPWKRELPEKLLAEQNDLETELQRELDLNAANVPEVPAETGFSEPIPDEENPYLNLVLGQMNALAGAMVIAAPASQELKMRESRGIESEETEKLPEKANLKGVKDTERPKITAGEILYAETLTAVDSRQQTPVAAVVVQGPLANSKLIGEFSTNASAKGLYLEFSGFVDPKGQLHEIEAIAIDGFTGSASVASSIDDSLLSRLGPELGGDVRG